MSLIVCDPVGRLRDASVLPIWFHRVRRPEARRSVRVRDGRWHTIVWNVHYSMVAADD